MFNKLERKFGKYAIRDFTIKLMIVYAIGYVVCLFGARFDSTFVHDYISFNPYMILHGQIWRLVTWILIPLQSNVLLYVISILLFYLPIGRTMENAWGDFKYSLYLFMGFIITIIAGFALYFGYMIYGIAAGAQGDSLAQFMYLIGVWIGSYTIPYYVTMSIFFAYAATYPDATVLFMFIIPIKMKWLGIAYAALYVYNAITDIMASNFIGMGILIASIIPFCIFFFGNKNGKFSRTARRYKPSEVKRRKDFRREVENANRSKRMVPPGSAHHKCAVCGKTEIDDPNLEFRYCSKCKGAYEYCQEHLFTHVHIN